MVGLLRKRDTGAPRRDEQEDQERDLAPARRWVGKLQRGTWEPIDTSAAPGKLTRSLDPAAMTPAQAISYEAHLSERARRTEGERAAFSGQGEPTWGSLASAFEFLAAPAIPPAAPRASPLLLREAAAPESASEGIDAEHLTARLQWSQGQPLPTSLRRLMETLLGASFDAVRIHQGAAAEEAATAVAARAFTIGEHVFFQRGAFDPDSARGRSLLAHELTHVLQWRAGRVPTTPSPAVSSPDDPLEREAEETSRRALSWHLAAERAAPHATTEDRSPAASIAMPTWCGTRSNAGAHTEATSSTSPLAGTLLLREADPHASVAQVPPGGTAVDKVGIVAWGGAPALRLRATPSTSEDNVIASLPFNSKLQVLKAFPGDWYFVSLTNGVMGYVAKTYVKTNLPEPNATLHKVEAGKAGYAISIAEQHYHQHADDWGQDLRFYVNVLAWVNRRPIPDTTSGWKTVSFAAGDLIWIPSQSFARSLRGVVNSGSISHNLAEGLGVDGFLDRAEELWKDVRAAVAASTQYLPAAIGRHVVEAMVATLESLMLLMVAAGAILALSSALGAAIGSLAGGVGAAPGAAAGAEVGLALLNWLGLGFLVVWIGTALTKVGASVAAFFSAVWHARGDAAKVDQAARAFAEAIGTLCGVLVEALVMWAAAVGIGKAFAVLRGTRLGASFENSRAGKWLAERAANVKNGQSPLPTPKDVWTRYSWSKTAIAKRLEGLFGEAAAREHFEPIGDNLVNIHGELKISGAALDKLSDAELQRLVRLCKDRGPEAEYAHFESSGTGGGKPGTRFRFESRLRQRSERVARDLLDAVGIQPGDARAKMFEALTDGDRMRLWDLFNEKAYKSPELRKAAATWAFGKNPKTPRELVAQMQFFEAEVNRLGKALFERTSQEISHRITAQQSGGNTPPCERTDHRDYT